MAPSVTHTRPWSLCRAEQATKGEQSGKLRAKTYFLLPPLPVPRVVVVTVALGSLLSRLPLATRRAQVPALPSRPRENRRASTSVLLASPCSPLPFLLLSRVLSCMNLLQPALRSTRLLVPSLWPGRLRINPTCLKSPPPRATLPVRPARTGSSPRVSLLTLL